MGDVQREDVPARSVPDKFGNNRTPNTDWHPDGECPGPLPARKMDVGDRIIGRPCVLTVEVVDHTTASGRCETCNAYHLLDRTLYEAGRGPWRRTHDAACSAVGTDYECDCGADTERALVEFISEAIVPVSGRHSASESSNTVEEA